MSATPIDVYVAGFRAGCEARRGPGRPVVDRPGGCGLVAGVRHPRHRLVVVDDRAYDVVATSLRHARSGTVTVFDAATACARLLSDHPATWAEPATAMVRRDLVAVPEVPLPTGLHCRDVRRVATDDPRGVPLGDAVVPALSDPRLGPDPRAALVDMFTAMPATTRLLAAVDDHGRVCATSGYGVFDRGAHVFFVNTTPAWRGRGVGTAMTGAALAAARIDGARRAHLDASTAGRGLYERLGFETAGTTTRFTLAPSPGVS